MIPNILSIAGSDPSGGAGVQADLKTFGALGAYGMAALTALTAQNTQGVRGILPVPPDFVRAQIEAVFADVRVDAVKIGMLGSPDIAEAVASTLAAHPGAPVVLDPVLASTSGHSLGSGEVAAALMRHLAPLATLLTPNLGEAGALLGEPAPKTLADMEAVGLALVERGARAVLVKGGHLEGDATDVLCTTEGCRRFPGRRIATRNTHGTGCTLSSAITVGLAKGQMLADAIGFAKSYLEAALVSAGRLQVGSGHGPLDHFHAGRAASFPSAGAKPI